MTKTGSSLTSLARLEITGTNFNWKAEATASYHVREPRAESREEEEVGTCTRHTETSQQPRRRDVLTS